MPDNFRNLTLQGIGWSTFAQVAQQTLNFIIGVVLARLLSPEIFGLIGMVMIFVGFANIYRDLGFGASLIQKQNIDQRHYSSIFWINIGFGLFLTFLIIALSPAISTFYSEPILMPLTILISFNFLIGSFNVVQT